MRITVCIILMLATFPPAASAQALTTRKGGHCYTMAVPDYMVRAYSLNDVATLQYQNTSIPAFTIVIEDEKSELESVGMKFTGARHFLENFTGDFKKDAAGRAVTQPVESAVNGNRQAQSELTWEEDGSAYFMLITAVETPTHFYKIMSWTTSAQRQRMDADFRKMAVSLRD